MVYNWRKEGIRGEPLRVPLVPTNVSNDVRSFQPTLPLRTERIHHAFPHDGLKPSKTVSPNKSFLCQVVALGHFGHSNAKTQWIQGESPVLVNAYWISNLYTQYPVESLPGPCHPLGKHSSYVLWLREKLKLREVQCLVQIHRTLCSRSTMCQTESTSLPHYCLPQPAPLSVLWTSQFYERPRPQLNFKLSNKVWSWVTFSISMKNDFA